MESNRFIEIMGSVIGAGYGDEIEWQRELQPCDNAQNFFGETCWVILNSGMKEQIARKIWNRVQDAWAKGIDLSEVFRHKGKVAALNYVMDNHKELFDKYQSADDKISFLQTIPFIGGITKYHLAKNLGHDCVKPDRHLVRIASQYGTTPEELCENLSKETGEKKCVIDIVIWRACNLKII
jgi:hypothetical protein